MRLFTNYTSGEQITTESTIFRRFISISTKFRPGDTFDAELLRQLDMGEITDVFVQGVNEDGYDIYFTADNTRWVLEILDIFKELNGPNYYQIMFSLHKQIKELV
jgi:hypothetical protein